MHTLRCLAVATTATGLLTGLPLSNALACDNDRFPCPIVSDAPETTEAPAKSEPAAAARKKATQAAPRQDERATHQGDKARPKTEREAARAPARAKAVKPEVQEQATDPAPVAAPVVQAPAPVERNDNPAPAWSAQPSVAPATTNVDGAQIAGPAEATAPALASPVATVDPNEVNELDLVVGPTPAPGPAESSWIKYLLASLGAALAAASTVRFLFV
jgi:hypothetical protein